MVKEFDAALFVARKLWMEMWTTVEAADAEARRHGKWVRDTEDRLRGDDRVLAEETAEIERLRRNLSEVTEALGRLAHSDEKLKAYRRKLEEIFPGLNADAHRRAIKCIDQ